RRSRDRFPLLRLALADSYSRRSAIQSGTCRSGRLRAGVRRGGPKAQLDLDGLVMVAADDREGDHLARTEVLDEDAGDVARAPHRQGARRGQHVTPGAELR